jgi:YaiO family outer membrane protein
VDWYQSLGGGFEASIGYHYLGFRNGVDIYIGSLSKYLGNWLLITHVYVVPDALGASQSYHVGFRRYFGDKQYVGLRYKHGLSWGEARDVTDILLLDSDGVSGELVTLWGRRWEFTLRGSWERRERPIGDTVEHYSSSGKLALRF